MNISELKKYDYVLILSFALIFIKGFEYLLIGVVYPIACVILLMIPFIYCYFKKQCNIPKIIKYWSILVLCYGLTRVLLHLFARVYSSGVPSGAYYQFTIWYGVKSILYIGLGVILLLKRKLMFLNLSQ